MSFYTSLLVSLGLLSPCCGAKIKTWHAHKYYCAQCESWLRENKAAKDLEKTPHTSTVPVLGEEKIR